MMNSIKVWKGSIEGSWITVQGWCIWCLRSKKFPWTESQGRILLVCWKSLNDIISVTREYVTGLISHKLGGLFKGKIQKEKQLTSRATSVISLVVPSLTTEDGLLIRMRIPPLVLSLLYLSADTSWPTLNILLSSLHGRNVGCETLYLSSCYSEQRHWIPLRTHCPSHGTQEIFFMCNNFSWSFLHAKKRIFSQFNDIIITVLYIITALQWRCKEKWIMLIETEYEMWLIWFSDQVQCDGDDKKSSPRSLHCCWPSECQEHWCYLIGLMTHNLQGISRGGERQSPGALLIFCCQR